MTNKKNHTILEPATIQSVVGLQLLAKSIANGYTYGLHNSRRKGLGIEFSQFRSYEKGDDLRQLDWKMLARSGKYFIKESEVETNIQVQFIVDASNSMRHEEQNISKLDYAKVFIATLAYIFDKQGDKIGLASLNDTGFRQIPVTDHKNQWNYLLKNLHEIKPGGTWPIDLQWAEKLHQRAHKELFICISDGYQEHDELTKFFCYLKNPRNEVIVIHVLGDNELNFSYNKQVIFEDLETGKKKKVDTQAAKESYLKALQQGTDKIKQKLQVKGIQYFLCNYSKPIEETIYQFVALRNRLL
ncbi:DUF58 domain-containing protein [Aquimarina sp. ERC-38]|uniref:DUF58 domain-containing protein n=1 Tax=Aquimarina sp. ERC-38 TaxID=2949996 RepID=UPI0022451FD7|nr:DUF58 domain-containing protein [Aquimarina sp. ERC-38]UZO80719.1 DUF58 domain-containing protein [Aquimarina sp. ERC-38]